jgi:Flp pilus assembly protein TadG
VTQHAPGDGLADAFGPADRPEGFARGEDGGMLVFAMFTFVAMIAMGGMAYDLMRHEQVRGSLQGLADNASLAAANLNNVLDPETVVNDYFQKAGMIDFLTDVDAQSNVGSRRVTTTAGLTLGTSFMRLSGIDTLDVSVLSTARHDAGDIEIALVLDVSGSMIGTREARMRDAAAQFVETVLPDDTIPLEERPTVSIVPYNDMVNLGSVAAPYFNLEETHSYSNCARMPADSFGTTEMDLTREIERIGHYDRTTENTNTPIRNPQCPTGSMNAVMLHSADAALLKAHIAGLRADGNGWTAISLGAKFGTALLDPSTRMLTNAMVAGGHLTARAQDLPKAFVADSGVRNTKVMVLMTDGDNTQQYDLKSQFKTGMSNVYYANNYRNYFNNGVSAAYAVYVPERASTGSPWWFPYYARYYSQNPFENWGQPNYRLSNTELFHRAPIEHIGHEIYGYGVPGYNDYIYYSNDRPQSRAHEIYINSATLDVQTREICDAAKAEKMTIYAVAFSAPTSGRELMSYCASSPAHYYEVNVDDIDLAFAAIGRNINQLRLTQ